MKILILQLARFGDIYCTWPALRALKRVHPEAELHILVRERFVKATEGLEDVTIHTLPTSKILEPFADGKVGLSESLSLLNAKVASLKRQGFDKIYNLSFSPFSSYLANALNPGNAEITGYHRFSDGFLAIEGELSAYFYAQVGVEKFNRFHVTDIFAQICGVQLEESDYRAPRFLVSDFQMSHLTKPYFVVHLGASQAHKQLQSVQWKSTVEGILAGTQHACVLIGSDEEAHLAEGIAGNLRVTNLVGKTQIQDLFLIIAEAEFLVGADSAPIHIASLVNTPVLNISFKSVNLWETGPRSQGSRILSYAKPSDAKIDEIVCEASTLVHGKVPQAASVYVDHERKYISRKPLPGDLEWNLIEFIYCGLPVPHGIALGSLKKLSELHEVNEIAIAQLALMSQDIHRKISRDILASVDELLTILQSDSFNRIIVSWFNTERIRIAPAAAPVVLEKTYLCHLGMKNIIEAVLEANPIKDVANEKTFVES